MSAVNEKGGHACQDLHHFIKNSKMLELIKSPPQISHTTFIHHISPFGEPEEANRLMIGFNNRLMT